MSVHRAHRLIKTLDAQKALTNQPRWPLTIPPSLVSVPIFALTAGKNETWRVTDQSHHHQEHFSQECWIERSSDSGHGRGTCFHGEQAFYFSCKFQRGFYSSVERLACYQNSKHVKNTPTSSYKAARTDRQQRCFPGGSFFVQLAKKKVHGCGPRVLRESSGEGRTPIMASLHKLCKVFTEHLT